ncbi:hypothetical protein Rhow_000857 [Rhodococcus wratislaviensis]|uniref:Uncharacterized protein n=1 Tax=Rhodococcus wratislaviensis TaxID=44752 RepID=A0A402C334_RHOWR|nr:hypothetical protein [Rhodococcus wratislaviensis]GCE37973.1 hypothetical protein Rhow_000857 [Rhodococcus wratislaviensis]
MLDATDTPNPEDTEPDDQLIAACKLMQETAARYMRWAEEEGVVQAGSAISDDDDVLTEFSMRETVTGPIKAALDQLLLTTVTLRTWPRAVRGYAHSTLLRSAITSASAALWVMDPDTNERRLRALRSSHEDIRNEINYLDEFDHAAAGADPDEARAYIESRIAKKQRLLANGVTLGFEDSQVKQKESDFNMVTYAKSRLPNHGSDLTSEWRLLSGRAHGLNWPTTFGESKPDDTDPRFVVRPIGLTLDRILGSVFIATTVTKAALETYAGLAGHPSADFEFMPNPGH